MNIDKQHEKYYQALEAFGRPDSASKQLMRAICWTKLAQYPKAMRVYRTAIRGMLKNRRAWYGSAEPNILVDTFMMANLPFLYSRVHKELEAYKLDRYGTSLVTKYASAVLLLISSQDEDALNYVPDLVKRPKLKDMLAVGELIRAIVENNQEDCNSAIEKLLDAHGKKAKFGGLRESPEGFLCLPAMSLSKVALNRGLDVRVESEYLSMEYLAFIRGQKSRSLR